MLIEGTWPDGDERRADQDSFLLATLLLLQQWMPSNQLACTCSAIEARNLSTSLSRALSRSCKLGYSNVQYVQYSAVYYTALY